MRVNLRSYKIKKIPSLFDFHSLYQLLHSSGNGQPFNDQCSHHIETGQLICSANQLTGFYMMGILVVKWLNYEFLTLKFVLIYEGESNKSF